MAFSRMSGGKNRPKKQLPWAVIFFVMLFLQSPAHAQSNSIRLIFHPDIQQQTLTQGQARQIFSARQQHWEDGSKIHVFVLDTDTAMHQRFCRQILQMFPYQLERIWNQITYSGQGDPPHIIDSPEALIEAVYATPGAVGYASHDVLENRQEKVKPQ
ncbi:hypothetical protein IT774_16970 [Salinimonas marina]|uniref:PBP domain-containing protein n=1 Tax=Salinimonas marina TaxID=2785918 RepID=A0A7S9HDA6_9ALTE|nr:hypothetical protein [Salinimonas marina]QPG05722.1 hypothetical protein IT774_16970 [Salinimonas marina]